MYDLLITAGSIQLQGFLRNGERITENNVKFAVKSKYKDRIYLEDFLKETGLTKRPNFGLPSVISNCNGWTVKEV